MVTTFPEHDHERDAMRTRLEPIERVTDSTLAVLRILVDAPGPTWGLEVIKESGRLPGTVYPILDRLTRLGWTDASWEDDSARSGPRRRYYELTSAGRVAANDLLRRRAVAAHRPLRVATEG